MEVQVIDVADPDDARLGDYRHLTDAALRRDRRDVDAPRGRFIVEGHLAVERLLASAYPVVSLLISRAQWPRVEAVLRSARSARAGPPAPVPCFVAEQPVVDATVGFRLHRGIVASARRLPLPDPAELLRGARTVAVLEGINDHENLGGLFRNAAAFGVDAVLLDPTCADPLYRRSVRVSLGHVLGVPYSRVARGDWPRAVTDLASRGFATLALTPAVGATPLDEVELGSAAAAVAVLLGAEGAGLTPAALCAAERRVRIPLAPQVDSLNVSVAAAIAFHHLAEQRQR